MLSSDEPEFSASSLISLPAAVMSGKIPVEHARRPLSVTDMFRIGIGPSSSHTVGPMRAALDFTELVFQLIEEQFTTRKDFGTRQKIAAQTMPVGVRWERVQVKICGSLGATGKGHATDRAVILGLEGWAPDQVPTDVVKNVEQRTAQALRLHKLGVVNFNADRDIIFEPHVILPYHVNGLRIFLQGIHIQSQKCLTFAETYYSVGGGFVMREVAQSSCAKPKKDKDNSLDVDYENNKNGTVEVCPVASPAAKVIHQVPASYPFSSAKQLLAVCLQTGLRISDVVRANEEDVRSRAEVNDYIDLIVNTMEECTDCGMNAEGILPGVLGVPRRAGKIRKQLISRARGDDPLRAMDWVNIWALAVNEENAAGHRVVTAPTNGAAGIIPAVLRYHKEFCPGANTDSVRRFMLAATAVGALIKTNASIAGAEVGCQGEVGSAAAMAAAGLAEAEGGSPAQVENAAEIAMEHSLGITCDPVAGLVQIPCIERNAIGAVKAINAARMALWGDGRHQVNLDTAILTMRQTGEDMNAKYKETSAGGLAVNVVEC